MAAIDPTKRAAVRWWDIEGPERAKLTVAWLDQDNREMAWDLRGLDAYWIAQCFKARDAEIASQKKRAENAEEDKRRLRAALTVAREALTAMTLKCSGVRRCHQGLHKDAARALTSIAALTEVTT